MKESAKKTKKPTKKIPSKKPVPSLIINEKVRWVFNRPYVMGIINFTPDSFYDGGFFFNSLKKNNFLTQIKKFVNAGIDIIDIGGESSRPGALPVSEAEELKRVIPRIKKIKKKFPDLLLSLDTYKSKVAEEGILHGVDIINDISAGENSNNAIFHVCKKYNTPIIIMHKKGDPKTMQKQVSYDNVVKEIYTYLSKKINLLKKIGLPKDKIMIDIGIGFGKHKKENLALLKNLKTFRKLGVGMLVGVSRKKIIGDLTSREVGERLPGTIGLNLAALKNGADVIRVHDALEMKDALTTFFAVERF